MHFRFHFDRDGFRKEFHLGPRGARWAAFARAMAEEFGHDGADGPSRRRRRFGAETLKIVILHLLQSEPRHGYELIKAIEGLSAGLYSPSPGMIYPMLTLLAEQGLISELPGSEGKRPYAITAAGEAALAAAEDELKAALQRLADLAAGTSRAERRHRAHAPVREALNDLKTAVRDQLNDHEGDAERAARIAEIIATATQAVAALDD